MQGGPNIQWCNPRLNKIVLFNMDNCVSKELLAKFELYLAAFYTDCPIRVLTPGKLIENQDKTRKDSGK